MFFSCKAIIIIVMRNFEYFTDDEELFKSLISSNSIDFINNYNFTKLYSEIGKVHKLILYSIESKNSESLNLLLKQTRDGPLINGLMGEILFSIIWLNLFLECSCHGLKIYLMKFCAEIVVIITSFSKTLIH